ncbi:ANR family transcriptional regulator [Photorhabdus khanii]|uniref:ANR family transcriptional regulator n=1 Tax=Photorhabdus khanii subsp. guanajuatensis TaxID=2100166 RepID=A0A4R4INB7_9GAMM|nr:ANR family transcriptional regulator [Photorhabdus khanii]TDB42078.1 hypothetical protein C5467_24120 [Photorhabdus khanii subsp. guanajuatensis]
MNIPYFNFSQRAIQSEKEEKYEIAAILWKKVAEHAKHPANQRWAECRAELNLKRHTLHKRYEEAKARSSQYRKEEWATKKLAAALKAHIDKEEASA